MDRRGTWHISTVPSQCFGHHRLRRSECQKGWAVLMRHCLEQVSCRHYSGHWMFPQLMLSQELVLEEQNLEGGDCENGVHLWEYNFVSSSGT